MTHTKQFRKIAAELGDLYEKKNAAYGNSFGDTFQKLGIISAVTRISDKYNRLWNLVTNPDIDNLGESIDDTLRDMASYCIMTVMELNKAKRNTEPITDTDLEIHNGDKFECIKYLGVGCDDEIIFTRGKKYLSEDNGCITDNFGKYRPVEMLNWQNYFKRIK